MWLFGAPANSKPSPLHIHTHHHHHHQSQTHGLASHPYQVDLTLSYARVVYERWNIPPFRETLLAQLPITLSTCYMPQYHLTSAPCTPAVTASILIKNAQHQTGFTGTYVRVKGEQCGGRPVYKHSGEDYFLFYIYSYWMIGPTVGDDAVEIRARSAACTPDLVTETWEEVDDNCTWVQTHLTVEWPGQEP